MEVRVIAGTAFVSTTEARNNFRKVYEEVLDKYPEVVIEKRGTPVAVMSRPDGEDRDLRTETF